MASSALSKDYNPSGDYAKYHQGNNAIHRHSYPKGSALLSLVPTSDSPAQAEANRDQRPEAPPLPAAGREVCLALRLECSVLMRKGKLSELHLAIDKHSISSPTLG
jgi:hypothetical protein